MAKDVRRWRRRVAPVVLAASLTAGCFSYQPVSPPYPQDRTVRVDLTADGRQFARERLGLSASDFTGEIQAVSNDTLVMDVRLRPSASASPVARQIVLPRLAVAAVSTRRVNVVQTAVLSAGWGAIFYWLIVSKALHPRPQP